MKTLKVTLALALVLMLAPLVSIGQEAGVSLEFQNAATAMEIVQKYTQALQAGDVATMSAQFAPNGMV